MIKNHIKIAFRQLWKHKSYLLINLVGLGIAIGMCILAYLTWKFDRDFDRFHTNVDHIYRVTTTKQSNHFEYGICPLPIASKAVEEMTNVEDAVSINEWRMVVSDGVENFSEVITFVSDNFLEWFDFKLISGVADLSNPNTLLITEQHAKKYFGTTDPVGKPLILYADSPNQRELTVTGVLETPPLNSSIHINLLTSAENQIAGGEGKIDQQDWRRMADAIFLILQSPKDASTVGGFLEKYLVTQNAANKDWEVEKFHLHPFSTMAHHANELRWNMMRPSLNRSMVWGTSLMGIMLLLTACLNFTNMTISLAGKRLKEIGVRKVMGSTRQQLITQLLIEGFILSLASTMVGVLLAKWTLPYYNQMWREFNLQLIFLDNIPLVLFLILLVVSTTLLAAAYPAFYISAFSPTRIFRGKVKFAGTNLFSRTLLGAQVAISMSAIVTGLAFANNARFQQETDLGFQRTGIQSISIAQKSVYPAMKERAIQSPLIEGVAGTQHTIGNIPNIEFKLRGENQEVGFTNVGQNYLELMEVQLVDGRLFNYDLASDYGQSLLVNKQFVANHFPNENPIGQQINLNDSTRYTIVGVIENFLQDGFFRPIQPLMVGLTQEQHIRHLVWKSKPEEEITTRDYMASHWRTNFPDLPFEIYFRSGFRVYEYGLEITNNITKMISTVALITLFLCVIGLGALLSMDILKRLKEITIRRILGAKSSQIIYLLSGRFLWIVLLSVVFGGILGVWIGGMVLDSIYKINEGVTVSNIGVACLSLLIIVCLTTLIRFLNILYIDPAKTLDSE